VAGEVVGVLELLADDEGDPGPWMATALRSVEPALGYLLDRLRDRLAIDAAEGRLAAALDAGQFGVATIDAGTGRADWSSRMASLHGQAPVRGAGPIAALLSSVHPDDRDEIDGVLRSVPVPVAPGDAPLRQVEYRVRDEAGEERWLATRVTATVLPGGQPQVSAITSDVTDRKRSEAQSRRRAMAIEGLQWVSQAIISGRELRDTAVAVTHAATGVLGATIGVTLYEAPGDLVAELAWAVSGLPGDVPIPPPPVEVRLPDDLAAAHAPAVVDLRAHPDVRRFVADLGLPLDVATLRSAMVVPILGDEDPRRLGTMVFLHPDAGHFTDDDVRLARSISASAGVAVENAQRHEQRRLAATAFQRELLPSTDVRIDGADVCVRYHPGRGGIDVGGDWYDVIELGDSRVGLAVGDVCGHGLTAAAHMGQLRHSFRALVQSSVSPEESLRVLNRLSLDELATTMTMVYVELDTATGACEVWCCGHLPPVVARTDGTSVRWLEDERGPMLGFLPELQVRPTRTTLEPGELLLLYTDGLVERRGESIDDGLQRLAAALVRHGDDIEQVCDDLYDELAQRGPEADDTAMLALRRS
jgi:serine phosphatase RsbU (regulator of sigma subunit)/PAS domain-containing protein